MNPRVTRVTCLDNYQLKLRFSNGEQGLYDCTPLLNFGVFQELKNQHYFRQASVVHGTVVWPHEQDICPDTLYLDAQRWTESA
jgi:hypothetical protein